MILKNEFTTILAAVFLLVSCNANNGKDNATAPKTAADSTKLITEKYAALLFDLSGSKSMQELICQGWQLEEDLETLSMSSQPTGMLPFRSFYLSADASYIRNPRNEMEYGHWLLDSVAKTITLAATGGNKTVFKIVALSAKELIVINKGEANNSTMKFVSSGKHYRDATEDPFHFSNNQWRIAPSKAETDEAIKKRLKAFLHFHILFYRDNIAKGEKTISFYGFPTCIKWYAGGIYVIKDELLPGSWFGCFYNKAQALKAKTLMQEIVTKKYKWQNSGVSWVIKNLDVLEQMYAAM